ncbi:MAG: helical backbone metal receptor [Nitrospirae bacterium]|nr:helical backbone metal receptor [Nitrospirota bacterium]
MKKLLILFLISHFSFPIFTCAGDIPNRIISLSPNTTEILFAMGLGDKIVGVTNFCDYPEEVKKKPKIGGMSNPSLEAVVSSKPDIVVMTTDGNPKEFEERLRSLKIRTYVFKARRLSELPLGIRELGIALDVKDKAEILAKEIEGTMNKVVHSSLITHHSSLKKKVLFIIWPEPLIVAGPGTLIDDVITLLGAENIAAKAKTSYPKYSIEEIIRQSPDVIFIGKGHIDIKKVSENLLKRIALVPAVKYNAVCYMSDSIYRLGPRVVQGIKEMAICLK